MAGRGDPACELDARAFPLSHAQKGLWFAQHLNPEVPILVAQYVELRGSVDIGALKWASEQGSFDIESPGIRLIEHEGEPYQLADETIDDELDYLDLRGYAKPLAEAHRRMDEFRRRPMNIFDDRLIAATLLHIGEDHYFLTTCAHHLILDGYGAMVLMNRVAELYTHAVAHTQAPPSTAMHLRDLYEAEDEYPRSRRFDLDREYWAGRTPGLPEPSRLTDRQAYPSAVSRLASEVLDAGVADQIGELARQWNSSEVPIIVAGFAAYLARTTGNSDIVLSLPVSARTTASARRSGGSVANIVPIRIQVDPGGRIDDLVRRTRVELTGALRHQRYRYEDIVRDLRAAGSEGRRGFGPMINIMMFHRETRWGEILGELNVLTAGPVDDLAVAIYPGVAGQNIRVDFEANPALYDDAALTEHHARFMSYLAEFVGAGPEALIGPDESSLTFWRRALDGVGSPASLPTDRDERTGTSSGTSALHEFSIPALRHRAAIRLAHEDGATLFTVLRSVLAVLLSRVGRRGDLVIGTEAQLNTLALRARVAPEMSFREVLEQIRDFDAAAFAHVDLPYDSIADLLGGARPQVALAMAPTSHPFDLLFVCTEHEEGGESAGLTIAVSYSPERFDSATVVSLAELFDEVLTSILADPDVDVGQVALRPGAALDGGVLTRVGTLAELLTSTAARYPASAALTAGDTTITYRELDTRSDALAAVLIGQGAAPGRIIALGLPRSIDFVIALWAITKTGAAFLPMDLTHPVERLARVLDEAGVSVGVGGGAPELPIRWVPVGAANGSGVIAPVRVPVSPDEVAYVVYTSGSTGTPKGVMVTHRGLASLTDEAVRRYRVSQDSRVLHGYNPTFDAAQLEMLLAFGAGACLVVAPAEVYAGPQLHRVLAEGRVTHYLSTPAVLTSLGRRALDDLRVVAVGGEALPPDLAAEWSRGRVMLNAYGPTESTIVATLAEVTGQVTIGRPIPGITALILDRHLRGVPVGGIGELYLCGSALARGYVNAPGRTAARFIAGEDGSRRYRTGDLVHRRADGRLQFIARVDRQVKIRGIRVEPGEIDAAIKRVVDVDGAVTVVRTNSAGADVLVSYVVPRGTLDVDTVHARLSAELPSYLVPSAIVMLEDFPLNSAGKLDVGALPAPVVEARTFREPTTEVARRVASVFADVLGTEHVGLDDDFFALGGNSLIATQLAARLGAALDADIPVRLLFEASTVEALADRVGADVGSGRRTALVAQPRPERIPLSSAQQRMWFLSRFDPFSPAYNIPLAVRLTGELDVDALTHAMRDVLDRHESLRTVYPAPHGEPVQVILPAAQVDLNLSPVTVSAEQIVQRAMAVLAGGFDVTTAVPIRGTLLKVSDHEFVLVMAVHHISADGFSMVPLVRDVLTAYAARSRGASPGWAPLPVQYADFALWQQRILGAEDDPESLVSRQLEYWTEKLDAIVDVLELPIDRPRPAVASNHGGVVPISVRAHTHSRLTEIARASNATLFMVVHTALAALLSRMSGTSDIVVGTPVAGRGERELDDLVGMFVNTLVLRTEVDPEVTLADLLGHVRETDLGAMAYADVPFERLVEVLNPARSQSYSPLFQVLLAFQNLGELSLELPGMKVAPLEIEMGVVKFDLDFTLVDHYDGAGNATGLSGQLMFSTELFDPETAQRFASGLERALDAFAAEPTVRVCDIALLTGRERIAILREWNATAVDVAPETLVDLFDAQVARTPDGVALVFEDRALTYAEFDAWSNRLARVLISNEVGPDSLVGLFAERSLEMLAGIYAILKAGGGYVPLDPEYPADRISSVIDTSELNLVLTTSTIAARLPADTPHLEIDTVDLSGMEATPIPDEARVRSLRSSNAAYALFTSGSTGSPKGVLVSHGAVVNQLRWLEDEYGVTSADRGMLRAPFTFDVSIWEIFLPLSVGALLLVTRPGGHRELGYLASVMREHGVSMAHFVPSVLAAFIVDGGADTVASLRHLHLGGEELSPELAESVKALGPGAVHNTYGPTEATITTAAYPVNEPSGAQVPIGRPVWNTQSYVLGARLEPTPVGVPGELYLAGDQLARGYLGRSELTADRFVANPFSAAGLRMYRTGDLVKWDGLGRLVYLGRTDLQVKMRGLRIELGEIEAVLKRVPGVSRAAATVMTDQRGGDCLVGYVVAERDRTLELRAVQAAAGQKLPSYMVPSQLVIVDELPLTSAGKLDRRALPAPEYEPRAFLEPVTESEIAVATAFGEVLGVERVGADDNFFERGGNSLAAVRVLSRLEAATGAQFPLPFLMADPTPRSIAARMDSGVDDGAALEVVFPIRTAGAGLPLFCIHPITGLAWCYSGLASRVAPDRPVYGIQSPALAGSAHRTESIDALAGRYVEEIRRIHPQGPYDLLGWSLGGVLAHSIAVQLQSAGEEVVGLTMLDSYAHPVGPDDGEPQVDVGDLLAGIGGPLSMLTPVHLERIIADAAHNSELTGSHRPSVFRGDVLFFTARQDDPSASRAVNGWGPYVGGMIRNRVIDSSHWLMTSPKVLEIVGSELRGQ